MSYDSFGEIIKSSFYRSYEDFLPSSSIISQDNYQNDFQLFLYKEDEISNFKNFIDNDFFMNLNLKEKTIGDKAIFKTNLKEEAPILYSFDDIKKIFKNTLYKKKFSSKVNKKFNKDEQIEALYLNKKRFRDYIDADYINGFLENENNQNCENCNKKKEAGNLKLKEGKNIIDWLLIIL